VLICVICGKKLTDALALTATNHKHSMMTNLLATAIKKPIQKKGLPILSLLLSLFGILFLAWDFQHLIVLFVAEVFLMLLLALIKVFFAQNELPFSKTLTKRLVYLMFGCGIGALFITFSMTFLSKSIKFQDVFEELKIVDYQIFMLTLGYFSNLFFNYFGNLKYKEAIPMHQMTPFLHVWIILAILQGFTGHLLPSYPNLDQAVWGIVALVILKFLVDMLFGYFQNSN
jgi:hypothetical protein